MFYTQTCFFILKMQFFLGEYSISTLSFFGEVRNMVAWIGGSTQWWSAKDYYKAFDLISSMHLITWTAAPEPYKKNSRYLRWMRELYCETSWYTNQGIPQDPDPIIFIIWSFRTLFKSTYSSKVTIEKELTWLYIYIYFSLSLFLCLFVSLSFSLSLFSL